MPGEKPQSSVTTYAGEELKGHLDALLLAALEDGPRHGYAVIEALRDSTGGRLDLPTGTIYPALRRLEAAGLIRGSWSVVAGRQRREYRLTAAGPAPCPASAPTGGTSPPPSAPPWKPRHGPTRLIGDYLTDLSAQLPAPIVAELADGLDQTHQRHLGQGLSTDAAATAAVAEFGEPHVLIAAFTFASPARGAARRLLATGPLVGACWGTALIHRPGLDLAGTGRRAHRARH